MGIEVRLISPQYVSPFVKTNKNDRNDAQAIVEAASPTMNFVTVKSVEQQDMQAVHRVRELSVHRRTALINQPRGLLGERGVAISKSPEAFKRAAPQVLSSCEGEVIQPRSARSAKQICLTGVGRRGCEGNVSPITAELRRQGLEVNHKTVQKLMVEMQLKSLVRPKEMLINERRRRIRGITSNAVAIPVDFAPERPARRAFCASCEATFDVQDAPRA
jgi:hypothetical protein